MTIAGCGAGLLRGLAGGARPWARAGPGLAPARLAAGEAELRLPVTFGVVTCSAHVLAEVKQPFVFALSVVVGEGGEPVPVDLPVDDAHRAALRALVDRVCG